MRRRFLINSFARQPMNQIWYTSTEGNVITPYATDVFGANIVSNTYSDGKGVIEFDGNVTMIGMETFFLCENLESITIPDGVTSIGDSAFESCIELTSVTIPDGVTTIGNLAFTSCDLTSVTIPDSVTSIGRQTFWSCGSLESVTIGNSVTSIGMQTFFGCGSLTSVYCKATTPPILGLATFAYNGSGRKIYVPYQSVESYKTAPNWSEYADYIVGYDFENDVVVPDFPVTLVGG